MRNTTVSRIALVTVMAAVTCALTLIRPVPVPATGGYLHLGDIAANFSGLAFGPGLGFLVAGGGMAIADLFGYAIFAPGTLVIHGLQAALVGYLGRSRKTGLMFLGAILGGIVVIAGYLLYEWLILGYGLTAALAEVPGNIFQVTVGLVGVPLYLLVSRAYPPLYRWAERS
jgi:uncharacterized membrane protein